MTKEERLLSRDKCLQAFFEKQFWRKKHEKLFKAFIDKPVSVADIVRLRKVAGQIISEEKKLNEKTRLRFHPKRMVRRGD